MNIQIVQEQKNLTRPSKTECIQLSSALHNQSACSTVNNRASLTLFGYVWLTFFDPIRLSLRWSRDLFTSSSQAEKEEVEGSEGGALAVGAVGSMEDRRPMEGIRETGAWYWWVHRGRTMVTGLWRLLGLLECFSSQMEVRSVAQAKDNAIREACIFFLLKSWYYINCD
ncbi:hypothetical protein LguiA_023282 [Lonicera macranthoides]